MSQALYRKYRSKSLDEVVGQTHITETLKNALSAGNISHAYLFTGPRGVGKTSVARILAHEINNLPYDDSVTHLDIIEIDAASNRGIEEIRDLREKSALAPTSATYKVYIIDEVHMLTPPAFNALLKTLEEPPAHVVFILATTEAHKLPETIISRTQRHSFRPIESSDMIPHLRRIANDESIDVDDDALDMIARHADGGFRDAISLLDHVRGQGKVTAATVADLIGLPPHDMVQSIVHDVAAAQANQAIATLDALFDQGYHPQKIVEELLLCSRDSMLQSDDRSATERLLKLMELTLHTTQSANPKIAVEVAVYKSAYDQETQQKPIEIAPKLRKSSPPASTEVKTIEHKPTPAPEVKQEAKKPIEKEKPRSTAKFTWDDVLGEMKGSHNTLYGILRMAEARIDEKTKTITLGFQFPFHMKRAAEGKHSHIISTTVDKIAGEPYEIRYEKRTMSAQQKRSDARDVDAEPDSLNAVRSVFGDAEIVK